MYVEIGAEKLAEIKDQKRSATDENAYKTAIAKLKQQE